jgi:hypothetical protein
MPVYSAGEAAVRIRPRADDFVRDLREQLDRVKDPGYTVSVHADTEPIDRELEQWEARHGRDTVRVKLRFDTRSASSDIQRAVSELGDDFQKAFGGLSSPGALGIGLGLLPALASGVADVAAAVQTLAQAGLALPGVLSAIGADMGTVKLATNGVGDAFEALDKASDGSAKSLKAADEALAKLAPSARDFVKAVQGIRPEFTALQQDVQGKFFDGLGAAIRNVATADLPVLQRGLGGIATAFNDNLKQLGTSLSSDSSKGLIDRILGNTADAQRQLSVAIDPLVQGLGSLAAAGTDVLPRLAVDISGVSQQFSSFITTADQSGALDRWINKGITGFEHLTSTIGNLGGSFGAITQNVQGDLLTSLDTATGKMKDFLTSPEGQNDIKQVLEEGDKQLHLLSDTITNLKPTFSTIFTGAVENSHELLEGLQGITGAMKTIQDNVPGFTQSIQQMLNPLKIFTDAYGQITAKSPQELAQDKLRQAQQAAQGRQLPDAAPVLFPTQPPGAPPPLPPGPPPLPAAPPNLTPFLIPPGRAKGGVLPGYSPGRDNLLVPLAGGEGIVRPEAVRHYGPGIIHALNRGFDSGGVVPYIDAAGNPINHGAIPGPVAPNPAGGGVNTVIASATSGAQNLFGNALDALNVIPGLDAGGSPGGGGLLGGWGEGGPPVALGGGPDGFDIRKFGIGPGPAGSGPADWLKWTSNWGGKTLGGLASATFVTGFLGALGLDSVVDSPYANATKSVAGHFTGAAGPTDDGTDAGSNVMVPMVDPTSTVHHGGGQSSPNTAVPSTITGTQAVVYQAMLNAGFPASEWSALKQIITHESGFNPAARNPSSGAFGLFQFLGHQKDLPGGYSSDPAIQSIAGMQYIRQRYGSPSKAWAFWQGHNWYDAGGVLPAGMTMALNTSGRPEYVLTHDQARTAMAAGVVPPHPNFDVPNIQPMQPRPAQPKVIPQQQSPSVPPSTAVPTAPAAPQPAQPKVIPTQVAPGPSPSNSAQGGTNHLLPWVSTAIESTASTLGNIAATAISLGGGAASMGLGGAGAGALGSFVAGGIKELGKVGESAANVVASSLVGSVPGSFGDPNHPYGELATSNLQRPATAEWRGFMGRGGNTYNISGHDTADVLREANNNEALDRQARLATMRG